MNNAVTTGVARISYEHLLKPHAFNEGDEPKYSCTILIPKSDTATVAAINKAIEAAIKDGVAKTWGGTKPAKLDPILHDGDGTRPTDGEPYGPECKGHWILNAKAKETDKPPVVDNHCELIIDPNEVYSGMYAKVAVLFYPYGKPKKGITCILKAVQKVKDGDPLGGGKVDAKKLFTSFDVDPITGEMLEQ